MSNYINIPKLVQ